MLWLRKGFINEVGNTFVSEFECVLPALALFKKGFVIVDNGCWFSLYVHDDVNYGLCVGFDKGVDDWKGEGFNCEWG